MRLEVQMMTLKHLASFNIIDSWRGIGKVSSRENILLILKMRLNLVIKQ